MEMEDVGSKLHAQRQDSLMSARQIRQPIESDDDIQNAFDSITYQKGAAVIGMFEQWMGPETFRRGVQAYMKRFAHRTATSGAFLDELSGASKLDVAKSFATFLNQAGIPMLSVALDCGGAAPVLPAGGVTFDGGTGENALGFSGLTITTANFVGTSGDAALGLATTIGPVVASLVVPPTGVTLVPNTVISTSPLAW